MNNQQQQNSKKPTNLQHTTTHTKKTLKNQSFYISFSVASILSMPSNTVALSMVLFVFCLFVVWGFFIFLGS